MEGECFLCCCLYSTVNNFIVLEHIELAKSIKTRTYNSNIEGY